MRKVIRRRKKRRPVMSEVSLTPLIDTALTLLIIFMVTTPMINNAIKVNLPKGQAREESTTEQHLIVYVDEHEKLFFNGDAIEDNDALIKTITRALGSNKGQTVYVKADQAVRYGHVIELVDHIKFVGGVEYVALATKRT